MVLKLCFLQMLSGCPMWVFWSTSCSSEVQESQDRLFSLETGTRKHTGRCPNAHVHQAGDQDARVAKNATFLLVIKIFYRCPGRISDETSDPSQLFPLKLYALSGIYPFECMDIFSCNIIKPLIKNTWEMEKLTVSKEDQADFFKWLQFSWIASCSKFVFSVSYERTQKTCWKGFLVSKLDLWMRLVAFPINAGPALKTSADLLLFTTYPPNCVCFAVQKITW